MGSLKFEQELPSQFKIDMRNSKDFDPSTQKSQKNCTFMIVFPTQAEYRQEFDNILLNG